MDSGRNAEEQRSALEWTHFDGIVGDTSRGRNLFSGNSRLSSSRLETLIACPYKYFLRYVLRAYSPDEPDEDVWMDAKTRGSIVHDVFSRFMIAAVADGRSLAPDSLEKNLVEMQRLFAEATDVYENQVAASNPADRAAVIAEFDYNARAFLHDEARRSGTIKPRAFELAFGISPATKQSADDPTDIFRIDLGGLQFNYQGRIDRVDELENGHFSINRLQNRLK